MPTNTMAPDPRTLLQRFWSWLGFGWAHVERPDDDVPGLAPGYMMSETEMGLDWGDRLRVLVSGRLHSQVVTQTDVMPRRMVSTSAVKVLPPGVRLVRR